MPPNPEIGRDHRLGNLKGAVLSAVQHADGGVDGRETDLDILRPIGDQAPPDDLSRRSRTIGKVLRDLRSESDVRAAATFPRRCLPQDLLEEMAVEVEGIVDGSMNAQKALRRRR